LLLLVQPLAWDGHRMTFFDLPSSFGIGCDMFPRVKEVRHAGEYRLDLSFTDETTSQIDLRGRIAGRGGVFVPLQDIEFFKQVRVDRVAGSIVWHNGVDVCPASRPGSRFGFRNQLEPRASHLQTRRKSDNRGRYDYGHGPWYKLDMREIAISKFKATCLAVLEDVRRTRRPVRVTRFGKPVAEVVPPGVESKESWLGCMRDSVEICGDIVGPVRAFERWNVR
jgi:hypothetical protein